jgi:tetratricopeptide (TPR) repeat protein
VFVLLVAAALGWYGYHQHATRIALHLADGHRFLATGQYAEAKQAYQQALAQSWVNSQAARLGREKATVFDAADGEFHPTEIQQRIDRILAQSPDDPHAHLFQGDLHATIRAYEQARPCYERAIARDPTLAHGYFRLGVIYDKLGQPGHALEQYRQAVAHAKWHLPYLNNLAYEYFRNHDYNIAIAWYQKAQALNEAYLVTYFDLAHVYRAHGQMEAALEALQHGVFLIEDPTIATLKINQEPWYFSIGDEHFPLDTLPQKQCYGYRSLAATLRALQRHAEADTYQQKSCGLNSIDERAIQAWVEAETQHMAGAPRSFGR